MGSSEEVGGDQPGRLWTSSSPSDRGQRRRQDGLVERAHDVGSSTPSTRNTLSIVSGRPTAVGVGIHRAAPRPGPGIRRDRRSVAVTVAFACKAAALVAPAMQHRPLPAAHGDEAAGSLGINHLGKIT